jgi:quercetin dioxygenase-like cupin family protein
MASASPAFQQVGLTQNARIDLSNDAFPTTLAAWNDSSLSLPDTGTHFGFVHSDSAILRVPQGTFHLQPGMYFTAPGQATLSGAGTGIAITSPEYRGVFLVGGPIEAVGRLRYIDGCTDSLLVPPIIQGDPCLNVLYFPAGTSQTQHTHPSFRLGLVIQGAGECITPDCTYPLHPGQAFLIHRDALHSFRTTDSTMVVIAYHPDSDFGPTHDAHPMINRTMIDGISASALPTTHTHSE